MDAESTPDWIRDGIAHTKNELVLFFQTLWACTRHPRDFGAAWARAERRTLNPAAFLATSLAIATPLRHALGRVLGLPTHETLLGELGESLAPFVLFGGIALTTHLVLRLGGSKRPLRATIGLALYIGGGPATIVELVGKGLSVFGKAHIGGPYGWAAVRTPLGALMLGAAVIGFGVYVVLFLRVLIGAHERGPLLTTGALAAGMIANVAAWNLVAALVMR
jgi:hypothetical protein